MSNVILHVDQRFVIKNSSVTCVTLIFNLSNRQVENENPVFEKLIDMTIDLATGKLYGPVLMSFIKIDQALD